MEEQIKALIEKHEWEQDGIIGGALLVGYSNEYADGVLSALQTHIEDLKQLPTTSQGL